MTWIAEQRVNFLYPDGRHIEGRIAIGLPEKVSELEGKCEVAIDGLIPPTPVHGADTLQALLLAVRFLGTRLQHFIDDAGIRLLHPATEDEEETEMSLSALFGKSDPESP